MLTRPSSARQWDRCAGLVSAAGLLCPHVLCHRSCLRQNTAGQLSGLSRDSRFCYKMLCRCMLERALNTGFMKPGVLPSSERWPVQVWKSYGYLRTSGQTISFLPLVLIKQVPNVSREREPILFLRTSLMTFLLWISYSQKCLLKQVFQLNPDETEVSVDGYLICCLRLQRLLLR